MQDCPDKSLKKMILFSSKKVVTNPEKASTDLKLWVESSVSAIQHKGNRKTVHA